MVLLADGRLPFAIGATVRMAGLAEDEDGALLMAKDELAAAVASDIDLCAGV